MNTKKQNNVTQKEVNDVLWNACDTFRGTLDATEYKDYLLVMLFVKYISDLWQDHYDAYQKQYGDDEVRIQRRMERERFILPEESSFTYLHSNREEPNIGELINIGLEQLEMTNKKQLINVFRNVDFNSESKLGDTKRRNSILKHMLEDFADPRLDLRPSRIGNLDIIGNAYEYLIGEFAGRAGKKAGEFYTPPEVSTLLAKLLAPKSGERIYDPACGSGSLLLKCANVVGDDNYSLYGQEAITGTWALCQMNMFLHDISNAHIAWGDTLTEPKHLQDDKLMKFEVVAANPPFSLANWGAEESGAEAKRFNRWHRGVPPKSKADYAFISHMVESSTEDTGRVGVVVPHGVLFRAGQEGKIRQALIEENLLDAVIGLPANLFFGTGIPAAIMIFRRDKGDDTSVLFIDASNDYIDAKNQNKIREGVEVEKILNTYHKREFVDKYAQLVTREELAGNDYNLNIPRYVDTFVEEEEVDLNAIQKEREVLIEQLSKVEKKIDGYLKELGL